MTAILTKRSCAAVLAATLCAATVQAGGVVFADLDVDGNGVLSRAELATQFSDQDVAAIISVYDADGDGLVSGSEVSERSARGMERSAQGKQRAAENRASAAQRSAENKDRAASRHGADKDTERGGHRNGSSSNDDHDDAGKSGDREGKGRKDR